MLAILATPIFLIARFEKVIAAGKVYKFRLNPVDPYDAFRGKYMQLFFKNEELEGTFSQNIYEKHQWVYLTLKFEDGFAVPDKVFTTCPGNVDYLKLQVWYSGTRDNGKSYINFKYPFNHYFMNENYAQKAESALRTNNRTKEDQCYATVSIYKGKAVVTGVYIKDKPIEDFMKGKN
jgi:uncharacterized membrane-anchored protein